MVHKMVITVWSLLCIVHIELGWSHRVEQRSSPRLVQQCLHERCVKCFQVAWVCTTIL